MKTAMKQNGSCAFFLNVAFVFRRGFWQGDDMEHGASPQRRG